MATRRFTKEIKKYVFTEICRHEHVSVEDVAEIIKGLHIYDSTAEEDKWCRDKARKLMASWKDKEGVRILFAAGAASGEFINIETCKDLSKRSATRYQLAMKRRGLDAAIEKNDRYTAILIGQTPLYVNTFTKRPLVDIADFL